MDIGKRLKGQKIAFIRPYFALGGVESICFETVRQLSKFGVEFTFFTFKIFSDISCVGIDNVDIKYLPDAVFDEIGFPNSNKLLSDVNQSFILDNCISNEINNVVMLWHTFDLPYKLKQTNNIKIAFWLHSMFLWEVANRKAIWRNYKNYDKLRSIPSFARNIISSLDLFLYRKKIIKMYRKQVSFYDKFIVLTPNYGKSLKKIIPSSHSSKVTYLINTITINPSPKITKNKEIIFAGRLELLHKQVDRLLRIWQKIEDELPDWHLRILGDGWMYGSLVAMSKKLGLQRCQFLGHTDKMQQYYDSASVIAMTSNLEGWPMNLIEAQNNAVVPIAFDCCDGIRTIIGEGDKAGVLVEPYDEEEYAKKLLKLCKDDNYRKKLQQQTLIKRQEYSFEQNIPLWESIIFD